MNHVTHLKSSTKMHSGLSLAANGCFNDVGDRPEIDNLAVVLTDGKSHTDITAAAQQLRACAKVVAVGIDQASETELNIICNYDPTLWFKVATFNELTSHVGALLESSCGE